MKPDSWIVKLLRSKVVWAILAVGVVVVGYVGVRVITGRGVGFGLWRVKHLALAVLDSRSVKASSRGEFTNVIFLHHSTGRNMIEQGGVRTIFTEAGFAFWDHHYNVTGLRDPNGQLTGYSYRVPDDNTDPDGLVRIFSQRAYELPLNALSGLMQHEVIVFKSCFPASNIESDEELQQRKDWYLGIRDVMDARPDKVFVVMSQPPLHPAATTPEAAARARVFADWLTSDEYRVGHANVFAFDFFDQLAEDDPSNPEVNMLRAEYRPEGEDSHPNELANATVGPLFADTVIKAVLNYREAQLEQP